MQRPRSRRDRGFSLIVVFLLVMVMVGVAAAVAMTTQEDLSVSGQDREQKTAFYAAEYAVAMGQDFLISQTYNPSTGWTALLSSASVQLCTPLDGKSPGTVPQANNTKQKLFSIVLPDGTTGDPIQYQFCIHNNADDPAYFATTPNGDTTDSDVPHYIVVEGYGYFGANPPYKATAHVTLVVGKPSQLTPNSTDYAQIGGGPQHTGNAGASEAGITINTSTVKGY
jgi:Tfp pilus assembly protein PilX